MSMFKAGIDRYLAQCADGGVLLKEAYRITDRPAYAFPATVAESERYGGAGDDFGRLYLVSRLRDERGNPFFLNEKHRREGMNDLARCSSNDVAAVMMEIMDAFAEDKTEDERNKMGQAMLDSIDNDLGELEHNAAVTDVIEREGRATPSVDEAEKNSPAATV